MARMACCWLVASVGRRAFRRSSRRLESSSDLLSGTGDPLAVLHRHPDTSGTDCIHRTWFLRASGTLMPSRRAIGRWKCLALPPISFRIGSTAWHLSAPHASRRTKGFPGSVAAVPVVRRSVPTSDPCAVSHMAMSDSCTPISYAAHRFAAGHPGPPNWASTRARAGNGETLFPMALICAVFVPVSS